GARQDRVSPGELRARWQNACSRFPSPCNRANALRRAPRAGKRFQSANNPEPAAAPASVRGIERTDPVRESRSAPALGRTDLPSNLRDTRPTRWCEWPSPPVLRTRPSTTTAQEFADAPGCPIRQSVASARTRGEDLETIPPANAALPRAASRYMAD